MDKIIKNLEGEPFSGADIMKLCDNETKVLKYGDLEQFNTIDELLEPHNNAIILYETAPNYGHWCCVLKYGDTVEFFDPYGMGIDQQRKHISPEFKKRSNQEYPWLSILLNKCDYNLVENRHKLQKLENDISTCGRHVCLRVILRDIDLDRYIKILTKNKDSPDKIVTYLTAFIK
jgi:hypothetical protein